MNEQSGEITFKMVLDASDLARVLAAGHGAAGGDFAALAGGAGAAGGGSSGPKAVNPTFMSIFKPLAALEAMKKFLEGIFKNSTILNTYQSAMGKVFGAAIDMLMVPFIPLFNLIMVGVSKLVAWLISSGAIEKLSRIMERATGYIESIAGWIGKVYTAITNLDFGKLGSLIAQGVVSAVKTAIKDPAGVAGIGIAGLLGGGMLNMATFGLAGKAAGGLFGLGRGMLGMGGAGMGARGIAGAATAAGGAGGAGGMGMLGMLGPAAIGGGVGLGAGYLGAKALGLHGTANTMMQMGGMGAGIGFMLGGPMGALAGAGIGAGAGFLGSKLGLFGKGGGGAQAPQQMGGINNSNNQLNATINVTMMDKQAGKIVAEQILSEWQKQTGFKMAVRG